MTQITIYTENRIGILEKVTTVFTRNRVNIECLSLKDKAKQDLSSITVYANISLELAQKLLPQLKRIVEVTDASILDTRP